MSIENRGFGGAEYDEDGFLVRNGVEVFDEGLDVSFDVDEDVPIEAEFGEGPVITFEAVPDVTEPDTVPTEDWGDRLPSIDEGVNQLDPRTDDVVQLGPEDDDRLVIGQGVIQGPRRWHRLDRLPGGEAVLQPRKTASTVGWDPGRQQQHYEPGFHAGIEVRVGLAAVAKLDETYGRSWDNHRKAGARSRPSWSVDGAVVAHGGDPNHRLYVPGERLGSDRGSVEPKEVVMPKVGLAHMKLKRAV